jgi:hypothetical protein
VTAGSRDPLGQGIEANVDAEILKAEPARPEPAER